MIQGLSGKVNIEKISITCKGDFPFPFQAFGQHFELELSGHLGTTPNYLLGVEEKEDVFAMEIRSLLSQIKDDKAKAILLAQIKAVAYL